MEIIEVPDTCPKCEAKISCVRYQPRLRILSERSWRICENRQCDFQESSQDYQNRMGFGSI